MSTRVLLDFKTKIDLECLSKNVKMRLIRLLATVKLKTSTGWSQEYAVIIDTGSPFSIIPHGIWTKIDAHFLLPNTAKIFGLGVQDTDDTGLSGKLGEVTLIFKDQKVTSPPVKVKAHLLNDDSAPFIIGFEDVLTEAKLICDYKQQSAYLEF